MEVKQNIIIIKNIKNYLLKPKLNNDTNSKMISISYMMKVDILHHIFRDINPSYTEYYFKETTLR